MDFEGFPYIVGWELTLACDLLCKHCGSYAGVPRSSELSIEDSLLICDQFKDLLVQEVNFTGGEPLIRPEWWKVINRIKKYGMKAKILTHGASLTDINVQHLKDAEIDGIGISLDGFLGTHEYIRGRSGLFNKVIKGIETIVRNEFPLTVLTTVNSLNVNELEGLYDLLVKKGVDNWQLQPIFPLGRASESKELELSETEYINFGSIVQKLNERANDENTQIFPADSFGYYGEYDIRKPEWGGCPAGLIGVGITSEGKLKGCLSMPDEFTEGDLRKDDLWDLWFNQSAFSYNRNYVESDLGPNCRECEKANQCKGGCSTMSYSTTGKLHNDPYCFTRLIH